MRQSLEPATSQSADLCSATADSATGVTRTEWEAGWMEDGECLCRGGWQEEGTGGRMENRRITLLNQTTCRIQIDEWKAKCQSAEADAMKNTDTCTDGRQKVSLL